MSFIDDLKSKLKAMVSKKNETPMITEEPKIEITTAPVVEEAPVMEQPSEKVEEVINEADMDLENISTSADSATTTESN